MLRSNGNSLGNPWRLSPYHTSSSLLLQRQAPWHISRACGHWPLSRLSGSRCWLTVLSINRPQPGGSRASIRSPPMTWWSEQLWWSCLGSACATRPKKQVFFVQKRFYGYEKVTQAFYGPDAVPVFKPSVMELSTSNSFICFYFCMYKDR